MRDKINKFLESELSIFLSGAVFGFIVGNNWKEGDGEIDWWLTITFFVIFVAALLSYWRKKKGKK